MQNGGSGLPSPRGSNAALNDGQPHGDIERRWAAVLLIAAGLAIGQGAPAQERQRWTVERVGRIGSQHDPAQALTQIRGIVIGPEGELYVAQPMDRMIRVFSADGRLLRTIGRSGAGPGEFDLVTGFGVLGDTLFVSDARYNRVTFFSMAGEYLDSFELTSPALGDREGQLQFYGPSPPNHFFADGTALVIPGIPVMLLERGSITRIPYLRIDRSGGLLDTLAWNSVPPRMVEVSRDGLRFFARPPFDDAPLLSPMADGSGIVILERRVAVEPSGGTFRVHRIAPSGDTAFSRGIAFRAAAIPDAVLASKLDAIRATMERRGTPPAAAEIERALRNAGAIPATLPPATLLVTAQDGTIWIRLDERDLTEQPWVVLSRDGALLATVVLPAGVVVSAANGDELIGVETDELDVQYIVQYRVRRQ
jgi:hypothetical protein